jgi:hypothetical protein
MEANTRLHQARHVTKLGEIYVLVCTGINENIGNLLKLQWCESESAWCRRCTSHDLHGSKISAQIRNYYFQIRWLYRNWKNSTECREFFLGTINNVTLIKDITEITVINDITRTTIPDRRKAPLLCTIAFLLWLFSYRIMSGVLSWSLVPTSCSHSFGKKPLLS